MTPLEEKDGTSMARKRITTEEKLPESSSSSLDLRWCSKSGRSAPPKRIGKMKLRRFERQFHISSLRIGKPSLSMAPSVQLVFSDDRLCSEYVIRLCVETALSSWNEKSLSEKGPEYELVEGLSALQFRLKMLYHCNFTARPKLASEDENKLFFAELKWSRSPVKCILRCQFCCILGPSGCETGLDCNFCEMYPGRVQHPEGGFTEVERVDEDYETV